MKRFVWVLLTLVLTMSGAGAQFVPITPEAVAAVDVVRAYGTGIPTGGGFSPDGLRLALIGTFGVQVYTFSAPDLPETFGGERFPASAFAFSPDGVQLVVGGQDYGLRAYDLSGQRPPLTEYPSAVGAPTDAAYHPSGAPLAISTYTAPGEILLLDPLDLSVQAAWSPPLAIITQLAYSPDGARVVVGDRDGAAALLDSQTGEALMTWPDGQGSAVTDLRFDAAGAAVWIGHADGQARRYTLPDGTFGGAVPLAEAFTPALPDLSLDITPSTVTITDTSAAFSFSLPFMDGVRAVAVTDDGLGIAIGGGGTVGGLFSRDGTLYANVFTESAPIRTMAYTPDGGALVVGTDAPRAEIFRGDGERLAVLDLPAALRVAQFSPDGARLYLGLDDGALLAYDSQTLAQVAAQPAHAGGVTALAVSADGALVLTGGADGRIQRWDAPTLTAGAGWQAHSGAVLTLSASPVGDQVVSGGADNVAYIWDATGAQIATLDEHYGAVNAAQFNPSGTLIVTGCEDGAARLYAPTGGAPLGVFYDQNAAVYTAVWLPDGTGFLTAGADGFALLYERLQ